MSTLTLPERCVSRFIPALSLVAPTIKEGKTILCKGKITLCGKIPELVKQEFWGMILAHYLVRKMMAQAALKKKSRPGRT